MKRHQHGGDIYTNEYRLDFSANLNPLGMPERVKKAAVKGVALADAYPDAQCQELRQRLAEKEGISPEQIVFGNGAAELIFLIAQAAKPRKALLVAPGFAEYEQALVSAGCAITFYALQEEYGFAIRDDYFDLLEKKPDMIFLCNPNNPTGVTIPADLLEHILYICQENHIRVVLDLCFMDFLDDYERANTVGWLSEYPNLFLLKAFTKTYAMPGLRLGYGMNSDIDFLEKIRDLTQPWNISLPAQMAGVAALDEAEYVEKARRLIHTQRCWLMEKLTGLGYQVFDSKANFIFFRGPKGVAEKCAKKGILIRDCGNYRGLDETYGYYRVAVRTEEENQELVRTLKDAF